MSNITQDQILDILKMDRKYLLSHAEAVHSRANNSHYYRLLLVSGLGDWGTVLEGLNGKLSDTRKRAQLHDIEMDLDIRDLAKLWLDQKGRCAITGEIMNFASGTVKNKNPLGLSIDRRNNSRGYLRRNVQLVTHWTNNTKSTWDQALFDRMIELAYRRRILLETV